MKLDVEKFMLNYSTIFWDSLWYFKLNNLEYDFMQPYFYRLEEMKPYKGDYGKVKVINFG